MRRWELWVGDHFDALFPASSEKSRVMARVDGAVKIWETVPSTTNEAMAAKYEHLGFGPYQPMLQGPELLTPKMTTMSCSGSMKARTSTPLGRLVRSRADAHKSPWTTRSR